MNKTSNQENNDSHLPKPITTEVKRPSQKLYVPKHLRNSNGGSVHSPAEQLAHHSNGTDTALNNSINKMNFDDPSIVGYVTSGSLSTNFRNESSSDENSLINSLKTLTITSNSSNQSQINENDSSIQPQQRHSSTENVENENDWYNLYDDSGECLNACTEVQTKLGIPLRKKQQPDEQTNKIDYFQFEPVTVEDVTINDEEHGHVIEIYDFPVQFKNEHIYGAFKEQIGHQNFDIKWVDDIHCLGIFSSTAEASTALQLNNSLLKTRPLSKSGPEARSKAQRLLNTLKPYKARPQTTSFVASRLIGASLGLNNLISKEKLRVEKSKLDSARTKQKKDKELKEAIWNGQ